MGACAGKCKKPEDGAVPPEPLPTEAPLPNKENSNGGEKQEASQQVDHSEPKQEIEDASSEPKAPAELEQKAVITTSEDDKTEASAVPEQKDVDEPTKAEASAVVPEKKVDETAKAVTTSEDKAEVVVAATKLQEETN